MLEHDYQYEHSLAWNDFQDNWVETRTQDILNDRERDLSDVIADYCDSEIVLPISGVRANKWGEYEHAIRAAITESPTFRQFMEAAAQMQAEKEFEKEVCHDA